MKDTSVNDRMIFEKKDPELLYHFSDLRPNVLEALVFRGTERVLEAGLPGYRDYESRVRWRLVPGIW